MCAFVAVLFVFSADEKKVYFFSYKSIDMKNRI